jgi:glycopeptide antibiotics resistance protein
VSATRPVLLASMAAVACVGLVLVVRFEDVWPNWARVSGGDVLVMIPLYVAIALFRPRRASWLVAGIAFALASAVEFSQLYHAPAIDAFRRTFVGRMTIGSTFVPGDFACYFFGTVGAFAFDTLVARRFHRRPTSD